MEYNLDSIGKRIRMLRELKNLKPKDIKALIGISPGNLHSMENDKTNPSADALIKLSELFGVTSDWILFGDQVVNEGEKSQKSGLKLDVPDVELAVFFSKIIEVWEQGDEKIRNWVTVQLEMAFPKIAEKIRKEKNK